MARLSLSQEDVVHHVATFGLDVYPPVEIGPERTRLNMFYEAARERWTHLYETLAVGETEFRISKHFRKDPQIAGPAVLFDTFVLMNRGPVFIFPLTLPPPVESTDLEKEYVDRFYEVLEAFSSAIPGRSFLRVGLVRELVFSTGEEQVTHLLTGQRSWADGELHGGERRVHYRDEQCNILLQFGPIQIRKSIQLPVGTRVEQREGYGLRVRLDVNNSEIRPLADADIKTVVDRALGLWPEHLLEYITAEEL